MASTAMLNQLTLKMQSVIVKAKTVPVTVWRAALMLIVLLWVCRSLVSIVWIVFSAPEVVPPQKIAEPFTSGRAVSARTINIVRLQDANVFGEGVEGDLIEVVAPDPVVPVINEEELELTKLDLQLVGVFASGEEDSSTAVIASKRKQEIYGIDDELPVGVKVTLARILSDRVIINNNGDFEVLWLFEENDDIFVKTEVKPAQTQKARTANKPKSRAEPRSQIDDQVTASIRPEQVPKNISEVVRFRVHREGGKMVGFRIRPGSNKAIFEQMQLKENDIVVSVNGIALDSALAIRDNYNVLKDATSADLEIIRGEETVYLNVSIDQ